MPEEATRQVPVVDHPLPTPAQFAAAVADGSPTPGGGAVAALAGGLSAALAEMVARLTVGKKKYAEVEETMSAVLAAAADLRRQLLAAIDEDVEAFEEVMGAYRLPKESPERDDAIQNSLIHAADVPLNVARLALEAMRLAEQVARQGNVNAASDGAVGALMGLAAVEGAALNVRVNAASLADPDLAARYRHDAAVLVEQARGVRDAVIAAAEERAGIAS
ncbi:MAG: cyclodeaminase/cyclohydrolase family protein [Chloroflexi bacterium]|nr:cyclodeaminase/cyclohydrolase family protein [Chloroflexota bacterium]